MRKDKLERVTEPNLNLKAYLQNAFIHPVFKEAQDSEEYQESKKLHQQQESTLVLRKRQALPCLALKTKKTYKALGHH